VQYFSGGGLHLVALAGDVHVEADKGDVLGALLAALAAGRGKQSVSMGATARRVHLQNENSMAIDKMCINSKDDEFEMQRDSGNVKFDSLKTCATEDIVKVTLDRWIC
jgi:hypothetical protein